MSADHIAFISGLLAVLAVLAWFYGPWQAFVIDWARQGVSELRDDWVDAALLGGVHCDPPEACAVRHMCDAVIEGMELLSLPGILVMNAWLRAAPQTGCRHTLSAQLLASGDHRLRRLAFRTLERVGDHVAAQTLARSVFALPYGLYLMVRAELLRGSDSGSGRAPVGSGNGADDELRTLHDKLVRRELEIAAAVSSDRFAALYLRRGLEALM